MPGHVSGRTFSASWLAIQSDFTVPVEVRSVVGVQFGMARNVSRQGAVLQLGQPPPISSDVEITFRGIDGSRAAPYSIELWGWVQHAMLWRLGQDRRRLRAVAVRWYPNQEDLRAQSAG